MIYEVTGSASNTSWQRKKLQNSITCLDMAKSSSSEIRKRKRYIFCHIYHFTNKLNACVYARLNYKYICVFYFIFNAFIKILLRMCVPCMTFQAYFIVRCKNPTNVIKVNRQSIFYLFNKLSWVFE